jgi:hypothetical protein
MILFCVLFFAAVVAGIAFAENTKSGRRIIKKLLEVIR